MSKKTVLLIRSLEDSLAHPAHIPPGGTYTRPSPAIWEAPAMLPDGLELRTARASDVDQIAELVAARGEISDGVDLRLVVDDPDAGLDAVAVVVDGDRVVSTATLLDETLRVGFPGGALELPVGQVELVATEPAYEGRGLVRALMEWAHQRSIARGHDFQVMIGIPYFYRLFGYEYAIDIPPARAVRGAPTWVADAAVVRAAHEGDIPAIARLQADAQSASDVVMPRPSAQWRWLLGGTGTATSVVERDGTVVATGRTPVSDDRIVLSEVAALDQDAAIALLHGITTASPGARVAVVDRSGMGWFDLVPSDDVAEQYYVRLPDPAVVLDRFRPVFAVRLASAGIDRPQIVVSTFGRHYRMDVADGGVGPVHVGGAMQAPGSAGGCGVAPDALGALLFGPHGMHGLSRRRADVYPGQDPELFDILFPPLTADLLTWYLPY